MGESVVANFLPGTLSALETATETATRISFHEPEAELRLREHHGLLRY